MFGEKCYVDSGANLCMFNEESKMLNEDTQLLDCRIVTDVFGVAQEYMVYRHTAGFDFAYHSGPNLITIEVYEQFKEDMNLQP